MAAAPTHRSRYALTTYSLSASPGSWSRLSTTSTVIPDMEWNVATNRYSPSAQNGGTCVSAVDGPAWPGHDARSPVYINIRDYLLPLMPATAALCTCRQVSALDSLGGCRARAPRAIVAIWRNPAGAQGSSARRALISFSSPASTACRVCSPPPTMTKPSSVYAPPASGVSARFCRSADLKLAAGPGLLPGLLEPLSRTTGPSPYRQIGQPRQRK